VGNERSKLDVQVPRKPKPGAQAVQELFPGTQVTIGPAIADGFYYDFSRNAPFTPEDFAPIEPHELYVARLRATHGKKTGFWSRMDG
jgi:hypothetical protein